MADLGDIKHRLCGKSLLDPAGCEICEPIKRDLLIPDGDELDVLSHARKSAKLLAAIQARLDTQLTEDRGYQKHWAKDGASVANSLARVVDALRKYEGDISLIADQLSDNQKYDVLIHWAKTLPKEKKLKLVTILQDSLQERILVG
jgi:hypothetical protein